MIAARLPVAVRIGVSIAVVAALLVFVPVRALIAAVSQVSLGIWLATLVAFVACHIASAYKWRMLMGGRAGLSMAAALRAHFAGLLGNLCLPGVVGGDMVRAGLAMRRADSAAAVTLASVVDRMVDTVSLTIVAVTGILWVGAQSPVIRPVLLAVAGMAAVGVATLLAVWWFLKDRQLGPRASKALESVGLLVRRPGLVAAALLLSTLIQFALVMLNAFLGRIVGVECALGAWLVAWPMAKLAGMVPVSAGGMGVREAALIAFLRPFGATASRTMAAGLLWEAVLFGGSLAGWAVMRALPNRAAREESSPTMVVTQSVRPTITSGSI